MADAGEEPGEPALLIFRPDWGPNGRKRNWKMFLRPTPPLSQDLDEQVPPIIWRIRHCDLPSLQQKNSNKIEADLKKQMTAIARESVVSWLVVFLYFRVIFISVLSPEKKNEKWPQIFIFHFLYVQKKWQSNVDFNFLIFIFLISKKQIFSFQFSNFSMLGEKCKLKISCQYLFFIFLIKNNENWTLIFIFHFSAFRKKLMTLIYTHYTPMMNKKVKFKTFSIFVSIDVNECDANRKLCSCADGSYSCGARCINTHGSFRCSCEEGYRLFRETTCVGK